jgi:hypothetical protein
VEATGEGDFLIFMWASGRLDGHTDIYTQKYLSSYNYYYSVLFALVLKPFYHLPFYWTKFCWLLLNLFLYFKMFRLLMQLPQLNLLNNKQKNFFLFAVFLFSFRFLHENIHASQITILILWCCVFGVYWIHQEKTIQGSLVLAMGISIKLLPVVLLPYLIYRGYFKAFFITVAAYLFCVFLPGIVIGQDYNMQLLKAWFNLINPTNENHVLDVNERSFHGLTTLLTTLFIENAPDMYAMPIRRNIADVSTETLAGIILFVRLSLVGLTLYFLKLRSFAKPVSQVAQLTELSYILLLVPLIFPHQQHYAFLFIVPAFAMVLLTLILNKEAISKFNRSVIIVALSFIYLVANLKILLGEFNKYYEHFKTLTYGALLLIPLLVWASRHKASFNKV